MVDTRVNIGTQLFSTSRLAAAKVARIQAAVTDGVLLAEPGEEALEAEPVTTVGRAAVPDCVCQSPSLQL